MRPRTVNSDWYKHVASGRKDLYPVNHNMTTNTITVKLLVGPDYYHPTSLEVKNTNELLVILQTPFKEFYKTTSHKTDLGHRIGQAIYDWNALFAEPENEAYPQNWRWLGIEIMCNDFSDRYGNKYSVPVYINLADRNTANINVNSGLVESDVQNALKEIHSITTRMGVSDE
jgi:hypothetical protein